MSHDYIPNDRSLIFINDENCDINEKIINTIGISKRLGTKVLSELDNRATSLIKDINPIIENISVPEYRYADEHTKNFEMMDSLETHYAASRKLKCDSESITEVTSPMTPKRQKYEQETGISSKRICSSQGNPRDSDSFVFSPVADVTRRIRRLRMNSNMSRSRSQSRRSSLIINTTLLMKKNNEMRNVNHAFQNSVFTFAKPTITSINKCTRPGAIFKHLKPSVSIELYNSVKMTTTENRPPSQPPSKSVFDRLYQQSKSAKTSSHNTQKLHTDSLIHKSKTSEDLNLNHMPVIGVPKSNTSGCLSSNLTTNSKHKVIKSNTQGDLKLSRPAWR